ncbi:MAG TPA: hypothetical protein VHW66_02550 [Stellaceae bacterium]|jgi:hypothetical protein|nr:hypothetical protein [Stellaceae bacterium]
MKIILSTLAAAFVASALLVQPAAAACWTNGYMTQCSHWHHGGWHPWFHHHGWRRY